MRSKTRSAVEHSSAIFQRMRMAPNCQYGSGKFPHRSYNFDTTLSSIFMRCDKTGEIVPRETKRLTCPPVAVRFPEHRSPPDFESSDLLAVSEYSVRKPIACILGKLHSGFLVSQQEFDIIFRISVTLPHSISSLSDCGEVHDAEL